MVGLIGFGLTAARMDEKKRAQGDRAVSKRKGTYMRSLMSVFPLLAIPVIFYNFLAFFAGDGSAAIDAAAATGTAVSPLMDKLNAIVIEIPMISGVAWQLTGGDTLILLAIALLFMEILKSTGTGTATIMNHGVSMVLFILCLVEFLMFPNFATSPFFIVMVMTLLDVLAGVIVTIVSARRDFAVGEGFGG